MPFVLISLLKIMVFVQMQALKVRLHYGKNAVFLHKASWIY